MDYAAFFCVIGVVGGGIGNTAVNSLVKRYKKTWFVVAILAAGLVRCPPSPLQGPRQVGRGKGRWGGGEARAVGDAWKVEGGAGSRTEGRAWRRPRS